MSNNSRRHTKNNLAWSVLFSIFVFYTPQSLSQVSPRPNYPFEHLELDLKNNRVESIIQDSYGFIWIGTLGGLHKFDGVNLISYSEKGDSSSSGWHLTYNLFEDSKKRLWASTNNGIYRYNREQDKFMQFLICEDCEDEMRNSRTELVFSFAEDGDHTLFIGNRDTGLMYFDESQNFFTDYFTSKDEPYLQEAHIQSIAIDKRQHLWMLTVDEGLIKLDLETRSNHRFVSDSLNPQSVSPITDGQLTIDKKNRLWISSAQFGIDRLNLDQEDRGFMHYKHDLNDVHSLYNNFVVQVYASPSGQVWACNRNGGLHLYNEEEDNFFRYLPEEYNPHSLLNTAIQTVFEDSNGILWIGSHISGVEIYDKWAHRFDNYSHSNLVSSINNNIVRCFYQGKDGIIWIGTDGGGVNFFERDKNRFGSFTRRVENTHDGLSSDVVLSIEEDSHGKLWLATWDGSINIFDPESKTFEQPYADLEYVNSAYNILRDSHGRMWVGTWSHGLVVFDEKGEPLLVATQMPNDSTSLSDVDAVTILEDSSGNIWVGTEAGGLSLVIDIVDDQVKFKRYRHDPSNDASIASNRISHIFQDSQGIIWIATSEGLSRYKPSTDDFFNYGAGNSKLDKGVRSIAEDDLGNLWLGTSKGLSRFNIEREKFQHYIPGYNDGNSHFSRYAVLKSSSGELLYGGENGFTMFDPNLIIDNINHPKVHLTGLKVLNEPMTIAAEGSPLLKSIGEMNRLDFTHDQSVLTFEFVGISYTEPHKNKYAYRMLGFEKEWQYVDHQREATYMNLEPGDYVFEVKACNNDGLWSVKNASIQVKVLPPWWLTLWAKVIGSYLIVGTLFSIYFIRVFSLKRQKRVLQEEVTKRTKKLTIINEELKAYDQMVSHDLKGPIGHIYSLAQFLKEEEYDKISEEGRTFLDQIIKSSEVSRELIDGILTFASADQPGILEEKIDLHRHVQEAIDGHSLTIKTKGASVVVDELPTIEKGISVKVYQLFYNLIGNALKFQKMGHKPIVTIYMEGSSQVVVEDNGIGFDQKYADEIFKPLKRIRSDVSYDGYGLGLGICKRIADFHGWVIHAEGVKGKGAKFVITFSS